MIYYEFKDYELNVHKIEKEKFNAIMGKILSLVQAQDNDNEFAKDCLITLFKLSTKEQGFVIPHPKIREVLQNMDLVDKDGKVTHDVDSIVSSVLSIPKTYEKLLPISSLILSLPAPELYVQLNEIEIFEHDDQTGTSKLLGDFD